MLVLMGWFSLPLLVVAMERFEPERPESDAVVLAIILMEWVLFSAVGAGACAERWPKFQVGTGAVAVFFPIWMLAALAIVGLVPINLVAGTLLALISAGWVVLFLVRPRT